MTQELIDTITDEFDDALASGDAHRIDKAQVRYAKAMMECQKKTADRVKEQALKIDALEEKMDSLDRKIDSAITSIGKHDEDIKQLKATALEFNNIRERSKGATWVIKIIQALCAGGGLAVIYKLMDTFGKQ